MLLLVVVIVVGWKLTPTWIDRFIASSASHDGEQAHDDHAHDEHGNDDHGHAHDGHGDSHGDASHDEAAIGLELTPQALKNLGLTAEYLKPLELSSYERAISVPAIVAPRPGRTQLRVSSPLSGVVTHVHAVTGEAVTPGHMLFEVRLTYEDLVESQTQFLKTLSELEVEERELVRLEEVTRSGAIAGKTLLERRYAKDKIEASLASQREALRLHGLSPEQIKTIEKERRLLRDLAIEAPDIDEHPEDEGFRLSRLPFKSAAYRMSFFEQEQDHDHKSDTSKERPLIIDELKVQKGQGVVAGEMLCSLSDYSKLYIEGQAFEQDAPVVAHAAQKGWLLSASFPDGNSEQNLSGLKLAYVENAVDPATRTLSFFVELPNEVLRDETNDEGQRFMTFKYRIGQRLQLKVPVDVWESQIVVPVDAVVKEGADWYVFQQNGNRFERVAVHVKHRDQQVVVIDNDGAIYPGDVIALKSAHQLQMAIKNKLDGGVDPHAGHTH